MMVSMTDGGGVSANMIYKRHLRLHIWGGSTQLISKLPFQRPYSAFIQVFVLPLYLHIQGILLR